MQHKNGLKVPLLNKEKDIFCCVSIGSSAGGFKALKLLIATLPASLCNVSILIAHPLEDDQFDQLSNILIKNPLFFIKRAKHKEILNPAVVYTTSQGFSMNVIGNQLMLSAVGIGVNTFFADSLFQSVAKSYGSKSIAIVLSGLGSDGAQGIKFVKAVGGMVMVQMPETAQYDGMPTAAIATACADKILNPSEMGNALHDFYIELNHSNNNINTLKYRFINNKQRYLKNEAIEKSHSFTTINDAVSINSLNNSTINWEVLAKQTLFDSYQHTYVMVNKKGTIKELFGDTTTLFQFSNGNIAKQNLWKVLNASLQNEVKKAFKDNELVCSKMISIQLAETNNFLIRFIVKKIKSATSADMDYLLIFEKLLY